MKPRTMAAARFEPRPILTNRNEALRGALPPPVPLRGDRLLSSLRSPMPRATGRTVTRVSFLCGPASPRRTGTPLRDNPATRSAQIYRALGSTPARQQVRAWSTATLVSHDPFDPRRWLWSRRIIAGNSQSRVPEKDGDRGWNRSDFSLPPPPPY